MPGRPEGEGSSRIEEQELEEAGRRPVVLEDGCERSPSPASSAGCSVAARRTRSPIRPAGVERADDRVDQPGEVPVQRERRRTRVTGREVFLGRLLGDLHRGPETNRRSFSTPNHDRSCSSLRRSASIEPSMALIDDRRCDVRSSPAIRSNSRLRIGSSSYAGG
jgi:hypothetical protein